MGYKVEKDMAKEKINLTVKSAPDDTQVKAAPDYGNKPRGFTRLFLIIGGCLHTAISCKLLKESKPIPKRRLCCGLILGLLLLTGTALLILVFAVFKAKDPDVKVNGVKLAHLSITHTTLVPRVWLVLDLNITVHNPNRAAFRYTNGSSVLHYQGNIEVGRADIPAGRLGAGNTVTEVVTLNVQAEKFLAGANFTRDFTAGLIPVSATTRVSGQVNVLDIYKHHAVSYSWCDMSVFVANATLASFQCRYSLHQ